MPVKNVSSVGVKEVLQRFDDIANAFERADKAGNKNGAVEKNETQGDARRYFNKLAKIAPAGVLAHGCSPTEYILADHFTKKQLGALRSTLEKTLKKADSNKDGYVSPEAVQAAALDKNGCHSEVGDRAMSLFNLLVRECNKAEAPEDHPKPAKTVPKVSSSC